MKVKINLKWMHQNHEYRPRSHSLNSHARIVLAPFIRYTFPATRSFPIHVLLARPVRNIHRYSNKRSIHYRYIRRLLFLLVYPPDCLFPSIAVCNHPIVAGTNRLFWHPTYQRFFIYTCDKPLIRYTAAVA